MGNHEHKDPRHKVRYGTQHQSVASHQATGPVPGKATLTALYAAMPIGPVAQLQLSTKSAANSLAQLEAANQRGDSGAAFAAVADLARYVAHAPAWLAQIPSGAHPELEAQARAILSLAPAAIAAAPKVSQRATQAALRGDFTLWSAEIDAWRGARGATPPQEVEPPPVENKPIPVLQLRDIPRQGDREAMPVTNANPEPRAEGAGSRESRANGTQHETEPRVADGQSRAPDWDSAVPTLAAIVDIVSESTVVDKGYAFPKWHPSHHREVPERYRRLLNEWFLITHGSVKHDGGITVTIRGEMLKEHIDQAVAETMPLILLIQREADPDTLESLDTLFDKVGEFRARATKESVAGAVDAAANDAIARGDSPISHLGQENQLKLASTRLITVSRSLTTAADRLAGTNKVQAELAEQLFKATFSEADMPEGLKRQVASAKSLADVAKHIAGLANGIQAVLNIADPELRQRVFRTEFEKYGILGSVEVLKTLGWLVQGSVAVHGVACYSLLRARGFHAEASKVFAASGARLGGGLNRAVNGLGVIHGGIAILWGETTIEKVGGAVESTMGALSLAGKYVQKIPMVGKHAAPWVGRHAGPIAAVLTLSWTTVSSLGEMTVGALHGMIQLALSPVYRDMRTRSLDVHAEATRLAVMMEMAISDPEQRAELDERIATSVELLASAIRTYVERTQVAGRDSDPGTWDAFRIRFKPLVGIRLESEYDVLTAAEEFVAIAVSCFQNASAVLEESVQQSVREHGEANTNRF